MTHGDRVNVKACIAGSYNEVRMRQWQPQSGDKLAQRYATYDRYKGFHGYSDGYSSCHPIALQLYSFWSGSSRLDLLVI